MISGVIGMCGPELWYNKTGSDTNRPLIALPGFQLPTAGGSNEYLKTPW